MTAKEINENLILITETLDAVVNLEDIEGIQRKLNDLSSLTGLAAECTKEAKRLQLESMRIVIGSMDDIKMPASIQSKFIEGKLADETALFLWCERTNSGISHSIDALRSLISLRKTEMTNSLHQQS